MSGWYTLTTQNHVIPIDLAEDLKLIYGAEFSQEVFDQVQKEHAEYELRKQETLKQDSREIDSKMKLLADDVTVKTGNSKFLGINKSKGSNDD